MKGMASTSQSVSLSGGNGRKKDLNMKYVVDKVFDEMVAENKLEIPVRFFEFYDSSLMKSFLIAAISYFFLFAKSIKKESHGVEEKQRRLETLSQAYARIVLYCSRFEHSKDDELFFECVYKFAFMVVRQCLDPKPMKREDFWMEIKQEFSFLFRGPNFDIRHREEEKEHVRRTAEKRIKAESQEEINKEAAKAVEMDEATSQFSLARRKDGIALRDDSRNTQTSCTARGSRERKFSVYQALHAQSPIIAQLFPSPRNRNKQ